MSRYLKLLTKSGAIFDRSIDLLALLAGGFIIFTMLSVGAEVFMRYFLQRPMAWVIEITEILLLYITFLAAAWVLRREGHVRMDMVINQLKPRAQIVVNIITSILAAIGCLIVTWYGVRVTWSFYQEGLYLPSILETPTAFVMVVIPVGSFLLSIQLLRRAYGYLGRGRSI